MAKETIDFDVQQYLNHIASYDREFAKWETRVTKILKRYRDDTRTAQDSGSRFNILWSNVQTLKAATFARIPKPDVSRRFRDNDQVGRVASMILERALDYEITHYTDYRETLASSVYDRFLGGRGVAWVRYEPKFTSAPMEGLPEDGTQISEDAENELREEETLDYECAPTDYVHWRDFGHSVARTWEEVGIVWRKVYMTRPMLEERFGEEIAKTVPLDAEPQEMKNASKEGVDKRALIFEIWDKDTGKALWLSKSLSKVLDERDDPLGLEGFFPCPKPLYATLTNESLVPVPDYALYQDQANALDTLSDRIDGLVKALQVKGVYDASTPELARLFSEATNNDLIPVKNFTAFAEKAGLKGSIDLVDLQPIAIALREAYGAFEQVKSQVYDITGISDIIRGQSVASETATAQQIKGQYASLRLKSYQDDVARFATSMIQLKAQIICKHFSPDTILMMSAAEQFNEADKQYIGPALELLKNEPLRSFRVEISTDSLIALDDAQEKQDRVEFLTATSQFLEKAVQASTAAPQIVPLVLDLLKFGVQGFRVGKSMEGQIEQTAEMLKKEMAQKAQQPPPPDPEQIKQQAETQRFQQQQQMEMQARDAEMRQEAMLEQMRAQIEAAKEDRKMEREMAMRQQEMAMQAMMEKFKAMLDAETKINVAEISAQATLSAQQGAAAEGAVNA